MPTNDMQPKHQMWYFLSYCGSSKTDDSGGKARWWDDDVNVWRSAAAVVRSRHPPLKMRTCCSEHHPSNRRAGALTQSTAGAQKINTETFSECVRPPCVQGSLWPGRWSSGGEGRAWERAERVMARQRGCWHYVSQAAWEWGLLADGSWARLTWRRPPPEQTAGDPAWWACLLKMRQVLPHLPICGWRNYIWNFGHITWSFR